MNSKSQILKFAFLSLALLGGPGLRAEPQRSLEAMIHERMDRVFTSRIKSSQSRRTRYFMTPFAYQDRWNHPENSHSWWTFTRIDPDGRRTDATISWLPATFKADPRITVFQGPGNVAIPSGKRSGSVLGYDYSMKETLALGMAVVPYANRTRPVPGHNFSLKETLTFAVAAKRRVGMFGPYEIDQTLFDQARRRIAYLEKGTVQYVADDRLKRGRGEAINCMHAVSDLGEKKASMGGFLNSGLSIWGFTGTRHVLKHFIRTAASSLLDPIDPTRDLQEFHSISSPRGPREVAASPEGQGEHSHPAL